MNIGVDARSLLEKERSGVGEYTYQLLGALFDIDKENQYYLFYNSWKKVGSDFLSEWKNFRNVQFCEFHWPNKLLNLSFKLLSWPKIDQWVGGADACFLPNLNFSAWSKSSRSILTVHDLSFEQDKRFFSVKRRLWHKLVGPKKLCQKVDRILAVSGNTKQDLVQKYQINSQKISIVYSGLKQAIIKSKSGYNRPFKNFILFLGTIEPRKNIVSLIRAFRNARLVYDSPLKDYQLIIAGGSGWNDQPIYQAITDANASILGIKERRTGLERRSGLNNWPGIKGELPKERRQKEERRKNQPVKYIGYVSPSDKLTLLCKTQCFVFPSLYEGFGLPVLEAMSLGVATITSNSSSLPEITGSEGAILVNPNKESEISDALLQIVTDEGLRELLTIKAREKSRQFSWKKCVKETLSVYNSLK